MKWGIKGRKDLSVVVSFWAINHCSVSIVVALHYEIQENLEEIQEIQENLDGNLLIVPGVSILGIWNFNQELQRKIAENPDQPRSMFLFKAPVHEGTFIFYVTQFCKIFDHPLPVF